MNMTSTNNNNTMLTLTGLDGFAEYNITVTAYTAAGAGTPSPAITVQTLDKGVSIATSQFTTWSNMKYTQCKLIDIMNTLQLVSTHSWLVHIPCQYTHSWLVHIPGQYTHSWL